jgi:Uma2 family endonuclease
MCRHAILHFSAEEDQIMAMPAVPHEITTIEELLALPEDGLRHELLDGVHVVSPAPMPPHQLVLMELHARLLRIKESAPDLLLFSCAADLHLGPRTVVEPDLFVLQQPADRPLRHWRDAVVPLLAVEILSPSTAGRDRVTKRDIYQQAGVSEYWIVDIDARVVERWRPADERPEIISDELYWQPLPEMDPICIDLPLLFTKALGKP